MMCDEGGKRTNEREKTKKMNDRGKKETKTVSEVGQSERVIKRERLRLWDCEYWVCVNGYVMVCQLSQGTICQLFICESPLCGI